MTQDTLAALLEARAAIQAEWEDAQHRFHAVGQAIEAYMREAGAQERHVKGWKITYRADTTWRRDCLTPLLEVLPMEQLVEQGAYLPEHQETVAASWDIRKLLPLARYNGEARRIIESAKHEGVAQLKVERVP